MKNIVYIFIVLTNLTFGQTAKQTAPEIEKYVNSVDKLKAVNKLVKISSPNMSTCGGKLYGYYLNKNLVLIDARYDARHGFASRIIYIDQGTYVKIVYREHAAEWEKYEAKFPPDEVEYDPTKITYADTIYSITLTSPILFQKGARNNVINSKLDQPLVDSLINCANQMSIELQKVSEQVDSLKFVTEMPYMCQDLIDIEKRHPLTIGCGDELYWNTVRLHINAVELLIDKLDDSTTTNALVPLFGYNYTVADIAYSALQEIIHNIPTFDLLGIPFDQEGCGYCSYWQHLNEHFSNRQKFKETVRNWYHENKGNLVRVKSNSFATCNFSGKHPNGGHYELKTGF